jgi:hypothetical protein
MDLIDGLNPANAWKYFGTEEVQTYHKLVVRVIVSHMRYMTVTKLPGFPVPAAMRTHIKTKE